MLTISHAADAKSIGVFGLVYQSLPASGSEFEPAEYMLYQTLPPRTRQLTIDLAVAEVAGL